MLRRHVANTTNITYNRCYFDYDEWKLKKQEYVVLVSNQKSNKTTT